MKTDENLSPYAEQPSSALNDFTALCTHIVAAAADQLSGLRQLLFESIHPIKNWNEASQIIERREGLIVETCIALKLSVCQRDTVLGSDAQRERKT